MENRISSGILQKHLWKMCYLVTTFDPYAPCNNAILISVIMCSHLSILNKLFGPNENLNDVRDPLWAKLRSQKQHPMT